MVHVYIIGWRPYSHFIPLTVSAKVLRVNAVIGNLISGGQSRFPKLHKVGNVASYIGIQPNTSCDLLKCLSDCGNQTCVGARDFQNELSCTTSFFGLASFLGSIELAFMKPSKY